MYEVSIMEALAGGGGGVKYNQISTYCLYARLNNQSASLFPSKKIVVSYTGIELKIKEASLNQKAFTITAKNQFILSKVDDRHNWIGKFELVKDGDWYVLERIETTEN